MLCTRETIPANANVCSAPCINSPGSYRDTLGRQMKTYWRAGRLARCCSTAYSDAVSICSRKKFERTLGQSQSQRGDGNQEILVHCHCNLSTNCAKMAEPSGEKRWCFTDKHIGSDQNIMNHTKQMNFRKIL